MKNILLLVLCWIAVGCSVPDDENWERVREGMAALPPPVKASGKRWAANRAAAKHFEGESQTDGFVFFWCKPKGAAWAQSDPMQAGPTFRMADMLACLNHPSQPVYLECIAAMTINAARSYQAQYGQADAECRAVFTEDYQGETANEPKVEPEWDPDQIVDDDLARDLISSPRLPSWLPLVVVGGVILLSGQPEFLPALCGLSEGQGPACPSNPNYPPNQTPQPPGQP